MTDDIRSRVDRELAQTRPPIGIRAAGVVAAGRRRQRGRRMSLLGGGLAVVVAAGLAFNLLPVTGGGHPNAAANPSGSASANPDGSIPEFPLPPIDDVANKYYFEGIGEPEENAATDELNAAFDAWQERYADHFATGKASGGPIQRSVDELTYEPREGGNGTVYTGYTRPVYQGSMVLSLGEGATATREAVTVQYLPKGSYLDGFGQPTTHMSEGWFGYLLPGCQNITFSGQGTDGWLANFSCQDYDDEGTGRTLLSDELIGKTGFDSLRMLYLVRYLPNGSAIVVKRSQDSTGDEYPSDGLRGIEPTVNKEALMTLLNSLPVVPVV